MQTFLFSQSCSIHILSVCQLSVLLFIWLCFSFLFCSFLRSCGQFDLVLNDFYSQVLIIAYFFFKHSCFVILFLKIALHKKTVYFQGIVNNLGQRTLIQLTVAEHTLVFFYNQGKIYISHFYQGCGSGFGRNGRIRIWKCQIRNWVSKWSDPV